MSRRCAFKTSDVNAQRGYTLIDMAMAVVIAGLVVSGLSMAFKIYFKDRQINTTKENVQVVSRAIENYVLEHGRFPCPAAVDLDTSNSRYGEEANCTTLRGYTAAGAVAPVVSPGGFNGGIWVEEGAANPTARVVRGMVPFNTLNLPEFYAIDGYGNRILYAVTASQTETDNFMRDGGAIQVIDSSSQAASAQTQTNHFLVFSAGANREGAYTRYGKQVRACGNGLDGENCNTSPANDKAIYRAARYSTVSSTDVNATERYDDVVANNNTMILPLWRLADSSDTNMRTVDAGKMVAVGNVVGPAPALATVKVNVEGTARSSQRALAADFCIKDNNGRCFQPRLIAGNSAEMDCNSAFVRAQPGTVMRGIGQNQARCKPDVVAHTCSGADEYIAGFEPDGTPICKQFIYTIPPVGEPPPHCVTSSDTRTIDCPAGQVGEINQRRDLECPSGTWTAWYNTSNSCVSDCVVTNQTRRVDCPAGETGDVYQRRDYQCPAKTWTAWYNTSDNCVASCDTSSYELQTIACPAPATTGVQNQRRNIVCGPPASWGPWVTQTSDCCTPATETANPGCGAGYVGTRSTRRDYTCPAATWSAWYDTTNTCAAIVNGACGSAHATTRSTTPSGGVLCNAGTPSAVSGTGGWTWSCIGANTGTTANCYADKTSPAGCFKDFEMFVKNGCPSGAVDTVSVSCGDARMGSPAGLVGTYASPAACTTSPTPAQINAKCTSTCIGACGTANGVSSATAPSSGLCSYGTASAVTSSGANWTWTCAGANSSASCSAPAGCSNPPTSAQCNCAAVGTYMGITSWTYNATPPTTGFHCRGSHKVYPEDGSPPYMEQIHVACPGCGGSPPPEPGSCGSANGTTTATAPSGSALCSLGSASAVTSGASTWNWSCTSDTSVSCTANKPAPVCDTSYKPTIQVCAPGKCRSGTGAAMAGSSFGGGMDACDLGGGQARSTITWNGVTKTLEAACTPSGGGCGYCTATTTEDVGGVSYTVEYELSITGGAGIGWNTDGYGSVSCGGAATPVNGQCGSADGQTFSTSPTTNLCDAGSASSVSSGTSTWTWSCAGINGGSNDACLANKPATPAPACGAHNGQTLASTPTSLCSVGTASAVTSGATTWTWNCTSGSSLGCSANKQPGVCGASNGGSYSTAPSSGLCSTGSASAVTLSGSTWNWTCTSARATSCSATKPAAPTCTYQPSGWIWGIGDPNMMAEADVSCGAWTINVEPGSGCTGCQSYPSRNCVPGATCDPMDFMPGERFLGTCQRMGGGPMVDKTVYVIEACDCVCN